MRVTELVPRNARHSGRLARGIENSPEQVVRVLRSALFVGKNQRVGMRIASLLSSVSQECCDHLRPERKISNAALSLRRTEMALIHTLANVQDAAVEVHMLPP